MLAQPPPNAREIQEFKFKLLARLRLVSDQNLDLKQSLNLVAAASTFGLICVGTSTGFDVIETAKIVQLCAGVKKPAAEVTDFPRRSVPLGVQPSHLDVSCDGHHLAVGFTQNGASVIRIYDITSLTALTPQEVTEVRLPAALHALSWNPGISNFLAACLQDGSAYVYDFQNNSFNISSIPPEAQATCLCWSPKGKQIVVGSRNGALNQFKPDLKIVKSIPPPQGDISVVSVQWLSNLQYAAVYCPHSGGPNLVIVNTPRNQNTTYINYEDVTFSNGNNRLNQFYFIHQQAWNVLLVASANSMEVGVLGLPNPQAEWEQWQLEDMSRAELPLSSSKQETHPVGMALDTSVQYNLSWGENQQLPPMPLLLLLSHEGLLTLYWTVNLLPDSAMVCVPPTPLPDTRGMHLFTSPEPPPQEIELSGEQSSQALPPPFVSPQTDSASPQWQQLLGPAPNQQPPIRASTPSLPAPKAEIKPTSGVMQGSWMTSSVGATAFGPSSTPSAFSVTSSSPAFSATSSAVSPFGGTSTTPSFTSTSGTPAFSSPSPTTAFSNSPGTPLAMSLNLSEHPPAHPFAAVHQSDASSKSGAFVSSSPPNAVNPFIASASSVPAVPAPVQLEVPSASSPVLSPVSSPSSPDPDATEESQELKAMNDALIQEAIREEVLHFDRELSELGQRVRSVNVNVINDEALATLTEEVNSVTAFMEELKETTDVQDHEVQSLRSFMVEVFAYLEYVKQRINLQGNDDYVNLRSSSGLDPLQARKMMGIRSELQFLERRLSKLNDEMSERWIQFQDSNKENREIMQIPSLEFIYQTMVMHNNVMMEQKNLVEELEVKVTNRNKRKVLRMLNMSRMIEDNNFSMRDSDLSKIAENLFSLNLNRTKEDSSIDKLEKSVSNLGVSDLNHSLGDLQNNKPQEKDTQKMALLSEVFTDEFYASNGFVRKKDEQTIPPMIRPLPISPMAWAGSISSGQPVDHTSSLFNSTASRETATTPSASKTVASKESIKSTEPKPKSLFSAPTPAGTSMSFNLVSTKSQTAQTTTPSFSKNGVQSFNFSSPIPATLTQNTAKSPPSLAMSSLGSVPSTTAAATTQQTAFMAPTSNINKGFSFSAIASSQAPPPFSSSPSFGPGSVNPLGLTSGFLQPFTATTTKTISFGTTVTTTAPVTSTITSSFGKSEVSKSLPSSTVSSPFKVTSPENTFVAKVSTPPASTSSSPLASLSSLVSGIEPLKAAIEPSSSPNKSQASSEASAAVKIPSSQPFVFKVSNLGENKASLGKDSGVFTQKTNVFGPSVENKQEPKEVVVSAAEERKTDNSGVKVQHSGALKKLSFDSPTQKTIFGGAPTTVTEAAKANQSPKSFFTLPNQTSTSFFGTANITAQPPQNQTSIFGGMSSLSVTPSVSGSEVESQETIAKVKSAGDSENGNNPVIEISLSPPKSLSDYKTSLEKLSTLTTKDISISKVEPSEETSTAEETRLGDESDAKPSSSFGASNFGLFSTPTKSDQKIFGGSSSKSPVMYEIAKTEGSSEDKVQSKPIEVEKQPETSKPQSLFGGATEVKTATTTSFTFSTATLQTPPSTPSTITDSNAQPHPSSGFSFGLKLLADTATASTTSTTSTAAPQTTSSFSFAQAVSQPSSTGFSFSVPITSAATSASSTFGFSSLSTALTDDKTNTGFSFGKTQSPVSTSTSIFGGFSSKPADTSSIFGQTTATTSENKSLFGTSVSTTDTKSVFGTPVSNTETKNVFGGSTISTESKNIFGGPTSGAETKSIFGQTPATTTSAPPEFSFSLPASTTTGQSSFFGAPASTSANFFGQPVCSPTMTPSSPFGQPTTTPSVFGSSTSSVFGGAPAFGGKPTFGQSGGSFFGQSSGGFGASSGSSVFGGGSSASAFGSNTAQPSSPFGQASGGSGSIFGGGSFSTGGQTVGQTGFSTSAFQNKPAFGASNPPAFGAAPAFGASPTFGGTPAFGSPPKLFGSPAAAPPAFGGGTQQQSSTFENLANQNTMTFGNLAQNQTPGFGSMFAPNQNSAPAPAFPAQNPSGSMFGGSSFSSWR